MKFKRVKFLFYNRDSSRNGAYQWRIGRLNQYTYLQLVSDVFTITLRIVFVGDGYNHFCNFLKERKFLFVLLYELLFAPRSCLFIMSL